ncbi:hypothetical protein B0H14DRAFT_1002966 [Mycena olivaceomarginata]|nr:hypothetical protein B0H14DRAFT_1002966 [Mycena olivaceomarginata]
MCGCGCGCGCTCRGMKGMHENGGWGKRWNKDAPPPRRAGGLRGGGMMRLRDTPRVESRRSGSCSISPFIEVLVRARELGLGGTLATRLRPGYSRTVPVLNVLENMRTLAVSGRPHTAFSPIASDASHSARTRSSPFSGMTTGSLILPCGPQGVPTLIRRGWVGRLDFLLGISPKVRNSESAFSPPAQRAAHGRGLRAGSLRRPPPPGGILFPSAPSAKLALGFPHFPTSCSNFTLAGSSSVRRREHVSGAPETFIPVCVSLICGLVGSSRDEAGGTDAHKEYGGFEAGWRSRVKTLEAPAQLVAGMRPPYPCAARERCAHHSFFGLSQYRPRKRERGRGRRR